MKTSIAHIGAFAIPSNICATRFTHVALPLLLTLSAWALPAQASVVKAINCGGPQYTATDGTVYEADNSNIGGSIYSTAHPITGSDAVLFQTSRHSMSSYDISVPNGVYDVTLKFAELFFTGSNKRVFDVKIEGSTVLDDLDIYAEAGHDVAMERTFSVNVSDGLLEIDFVAGVNNPTINAILVESERSHLYANLFDGPAGGSVSGAADVGGDLPHTGPLVGLNGAGRLVPTSNVAWSSLRVGLGQPNLRTQPIDAVSVRVRLKAPQSSWLGFGFSESNVDSLIKTGSNTGPFVQIWNNSITVNSGAVTAGTNHTLSGTHTAGQVFDLEMIYRFNNTVDLLVNGEIVASGLSIEHVFNGVPSEPVLGYLTLQFRSQPTDGSVYMDDVCVFGFSEWVEYFRLGSAFAQGRYVADPTGDFNDESTALADTHTDVFWADGMDERRAHWYAAYAGDDTFYLINRYSGRKLKRASNVDLVAPADTSAAVRWRLGSSLHNGQSYTTIESVAVPGSHLSQLNSSLACPVIAVGGRQRWNLEMLPVGASHAIVRYDENSDDALYGFSILTYGSGYGTTGNYMAARAFEAEGQACIGLGAIGWIATADADSLVIRFSLDDAPNGGGITRKIKVSKYGSVNQSQQIILNSKYAWLYGFSNSTNRPDVDDPAFGPPRRAWDHIRVPLNFTINAGDTLRISIDDGISGGIWIDYVETEMRPAPIPAPSGAIVVNPGGSIANAIQSASTGDTIYLAAGTHTAERLSTGSKSLTFRGAGMWHTTLHFNDPTSTGLVGGNINVRDLHIKGERTWRLQEQYGLTTTGNGSVIDSVWVQHTTHGINFRNSENLQIQNCRVYDCFSDGIYGWGYNINTIMQNNVVRHANDDGLVVNGSSTNDRSENWFCYHNTVEFNSRAAGIAMHRHKQARVYGNLVKDCWNGGALRATSDFEGMAWPTETENRFCNNVLENNRGIAEIHLSARYGAVEGVRFYNNISTGSKVSQGLVHVSESPQANSPAIKRVTVENNYFDQWNNTLTTQHLLTFSVTTNVTGEISVVNNDVTYTGAVAPGQYNTNPANIDLTVNGNIILPE